MSFYEHIKRTGRVLSIILTLSFIIAFLKGIVSASVYVMSNQYLMHKMLRIIAGTFQNSINYWTILAVILSVGLLLVSIIILAMLHFLIFKRKDYTGLLKIAVTAGVCFMLNVSGAWAIKYHWMSYSYFSMQLLAGSVYFAGTLVLFWIFLKVRWGKIFTEKRVIFARKIAYIFISFLLILNIAVYLDKKTNSSSRPNVLLIVVDTLRADHLGSYGYDRDTSPNIDRLALQSILFENAIAHAPLTPASVSSTMTSRYPAVIGFKDGNLLFKVSNRFVTLAEVLKNNWYKTKAIVSHSLLSYKLGFSQGFDSYDEKNAKGHGYISSPSLVEKAVTFLEGNKNEKFFLFLHFFDPHYEYMKHKEFDFYPDYNGKLFSGQLIYDLLDIAPEMNKDDVKFINALYDSEIKYTDKHIGMIIDKLKELGIFDNTLIIFTADHGEEFLERGDGWIGHAKKLYQEQIHVPLIMKMPGNNNAKVVKDYIGLVDLMPTVLDSLGVTIPATYIFDGKALNLDLTENYSDRPIISETTKWARLLSIIQREWKFIFNLQTNRRELYNLKNDPLELHNLADINIAKSNEMETILLSWSKYIGPTVSGATMKQPDLSAEQLERLRSLGYIN